ncbi:hypothetical protein RRG08_044390 [Elysia crispata]|uniref:Uncharacterized protein n=1 Tax=Elysia crispata TaxID=231223 RepID=A0AAE0ZW63_9GAST|nr:hypothetical protein RRG08_044390 [Elysia crispata]
MALRLLSHLSTASVISILMDSLREGLVGVETGGRGPLTSSPYSSLCASVSCLTLLGHFDAVNKSPPPPFPPPLVPRSQTATSLTAHTGDRIRLDSDTTKSEGTRFFGSG